MAAGTNSGWKPFRLQDKLRVFLAGMRFAILNDRNVALQTIASLVILALTFWLREWFDFVLIVIVTGLVLVVEMINTAIEAICDYIQPEHDPRIGVIKDIAAAASGIAILIWSVTMIYEAIRIWSIF